MTSGLQAFLDCKSEEELIKSKEEFSWGRELTGVYFLINKDKIQYVGKTTDFSKRLFQHYSKGEIPFTHFNFLPFQKEEIDRQEMMYIYKFQPLFNKKLWNKNAARYFGLIHLSTVKNTIKQIAKRSNKDNLVFIHDLKKIIKKGLIKPVLCDLYDVEDIVHVINKITVNNSWLYGEFCDIIKTIPEECNKNGKIYDF